MEKATQKKTQYIITALGPLFLIKLLGISNSPSGSLYHYLASGQVGQPGGRISVIPEGAGPRGCADSLPDAIIGGATFSAAAIVRSRAPGRRVTTSLGDGRA